MRQLTRAQRAAIGAADHALDHNPQLQHLLVEDYGLARAEVLSLRELMDARRRALTRDPNEPGSMPAESNARPWGLESRSNLKPGDGVARYGDEDHTGFGAGCVF